MANHIIDLSNMDYNQLCRGCLAEGNLKSIFSEVTDANGNVPIAEMLMACTSITIQQNDGLPWQVCDTCIYQITQSYLFKKQCERVDESLHYYADIKNKLDEYYLELKEESEHDTTDAAVDADEDSLPYAEVEIVAENDKKAKRVRKDSVSISFCDTKDGKQPPDGASPRKRNYMCEICSKTFLTASHRQSHMLVHSKEKPFVCTVCERRFNSKPNLKRHVMTHTGERPHRCEVCGKGFIQSVTLADHLRVHTRETPFVCSACGRGFKQAGELRRHMKKFHDPNNDAGGTGTGVKKRRPRGDPATKQPAGERRKYRIKTEKAFLCSNCGKSFASNTLLEIHNRIHTGEKPYKCTVCGKAFSQVSTLRTHTLVHTGEKKYDCTHCNKSFRHRVALKQHILIHMGIRKYCCTFCPKTFTQSSQLHYHLRTHTGEKPYACEVCGKCFALKGNLTVHVRTHTGETPYICPVCGKGFYDSSSMKKHRKGHGD